VRRPKSNKKITYIISKHSTRKLSGIMQIRLKMPENNKKAYSGIPDLGIRKCLASCSSHLHPQKKAPSSHWIEDQEGFRTILQIFVPIKP
jgi:hypothetical protein